MAGLIVVSIVGFISMTVVFEEKRPVRDETRTVPSFDVKVPPPIPGKKDVSQKQIENGIKAKQLEFEAQEPEYPSSERLQYEINKNGTSYPDMHTADAQLWDVVRVLAPSQEALDSIVIFEVYFDEWDDTLASVESQDDKNSDWLFSINYVAVTNFE